MHPDVAFPFGDLGRIGPRLVYRGDQGKGIDRIGSRTHPDGIADRQPELTGELAFHGHIRDLRGRSCEGDGPEGQSEEPVT
jgi:hypothetical protein